MRLDAIYAGFWELSTCRAMGMGGVGPIPWDKKLQYALSSGYDDDESREFFISLITALDDEYLLVQSNEARKATAAAEAKRGVARRGK
jgi:hypothetical protein